MTLPSFMRKPLAVKRYPTVSDHGRQTVDYTATPATFTVYGDAQPGPGTEDEVNRNGRQLVMTVWTDPTGTVRDGDVMTLNGLDHIVNGEPERWRSGVLDHDVVHLSRWEG